MNMETPPATKKTPKPKLSTLKKPSFTPKDPFSPATTDSPEEGLKEKSLKNSGLISELKEININKNYKDYFRVGKYLGEGMHSVVYLCIEKETGIERALKLLKRSGEEEIVNGMKECMNIMKQLDDTSIIKGYYLFINESTLSCQLVAEYCSYPELRHFMNETTKRGEKLSEDRVAGIISAILNCLQYLKEKGVCHRDIKPENILYDPVSGKIKLIDFEIARIRKNIEEKLQLITRTGSFFYRAPEEISGCYGEQVDIWAAGIIAYEMLVGELPFYSQFDEQMANLIKKCQINFDSLDISQEAKNFLQKILTPDPERRLTPEEALSHPFIMGKLPSERKQDSHRKSSQEEKETESSSPLTFASTIRTSNGG